jgi:peroxiredoxin
VELRDMYERFEALDTVVVAISQEDEDLSLAARMAQTVEAPFDIAFDLQRKKSFAYDRTTAYLIDKRGVVREIFPMIIHARPSWEIILREVERMLAADAK